MLVNTDRSSHPSSPFPRDTSRRNGRRAGLLYVVGLVLIALSSALAAVPGYILILGVCIMLGLGLGAVIPDPSGLRNHHQ
jgi:MFS family permease